MKPFLKLTTFALILLILAGVALILWMTHNRAMVLVHPARTAPAQTLDDFGITNWEEVTFNSADDLRLEGWFVPPAADSNGATVIVVHGFSGNRGGLVGQGALLAQNGYGVLMFDLRGHGESEGDKTTLALNEPQDVRGAFDYLLTRPEVNPDRIALLGESLGGATVIRAAAQMPEIRAVIAQAAYSSLEDNINEGVRNIAGLPPFPFAPLVIFFAEMEAGGRVSSVRPVDEIGSIAPRPVLLMHGTEDGLINVSNSERLYAAAGEPKSLVLFEGAAHGGLHFADPALFESSVLPFLAAALRDS